MPKPKTVLAVQDVWEEDEGEIPHIDFDEASRAWRRNKYREANGMRYFRSVGDAVYVNTGMRWREGVVSGVKATSVDVVVGGRQMRGVADAKSHVQCVSSTAVVERPDGDGYDHRPTRRVERREMLRSGEKAPVDELIACRESI
jgi:hypothetical protein